VIVAGEIRIPSHAGIAGSVFTTGKTENIPDVYADARFDQSVDRRRGTAPARSWRCRSSTTPAPGSA
jgi:hypothetical protein